MRLGDRDTIIKDTLESINTMLTIHGLDEVTAGSPTYNKLCGHIDRELAKLKPSKPVGRPKTKGEIKKETVKI